MLDSHGRKLINPAIEKTAEFFIERKVSANSVTKLAFLVGILASLTIYFYSSLLGVGLLWISGFLDAVDGSIARLNHESTDFGTLMDISFDRLVEIGIILVLALKYPEARLSLLFLSTAIICSMTVFLTVGALSDKKSQKTFYYQPGLMERTEGFIMFSIMAVFPKYIVYTTSIYGILVFFTAGQRFFEARRILK